LNFQVLMYNLQQMFQKKVPYTEHRVREINLKYPNKNISLSNAILKTVLLSIFLAGFIGQLVCNSNSFSNSRGKQSNYVPFMHEKTTTVISNITSPTTILKIAKHLRQKVREMAPKTQDSTRFIDKHDFWSLFHGDVPLHILKEKLSNLKKVSLVISHCDKPLDWIAGNFTKGYESLIDKVWVFTKCGNDVIGAPPGSEIITLPNVGRCDHTYAHWMNNFLASEINDATSERDVVVFMKDNDHQRQKGKWGNRTFGELLGIAATNGFGCMIPPKMIHERAPKNSSVFSKYVVLRTFYFIRAAHVREQRDEVEGFKSKMFENIGQWVDKLQLKPIVTQNLVPVCYGGVFATTKSQINKQPKKSWEAIEKSLSRGNNIHEGHFAERMWAALLSKPLHEESARSLWNLKPRHLCRENRPGGALWQLCGLLWSN